MCGIFAYVGGDEKNVAEKAYLGLRDLEYRGYDSWGIATLNSLSKNPEITRIRAVGKISEKNEADFEHLRGNITIGHSRWATHGGVSEQNSHPHLSFDGTIAVVHNGIIENHSELRKFLVERTGIPEAELFRSETDTEVIPHLIAYFINQGKSFADAFTATGNILEGRYAIVAIQSGSAFVMAMRFGSPLVVGKSDDGYYLASDIPAFLDYTNIVAYPNDKVALKLSPDEIFSWNIVNGREVNITWHSIAWDKVSASKDGYPHFMLKEIFEQTHALSVAIKQDEEKISEVVRLIRESKQLFFIGCGTAAKMGKLGELYFAKIAKKFSGTFVGSEFDMYSEFLDKDGLLFAISQSGETADVLEALTTAKQQGSKIVALLNVVDSSVDRMSHRSLYINAGPEIAVASTKAATAQIAVLLLLAYAYENKLAEGKKFLNAVVADISLWLSLKLAHDINIIAEKIHRTTDLYIIGRGLSAPIAHEAAIKIQEVSYIHAEGFPGGELKHGPIALITNGTPVIVIMPNDETQRDMESNTTELKARGAYVIGIAPENNKLFDEWISVPDVGLASPIVSLIPIQLLAYQLALLKGNNPDMPRNLAKSVTVK